MVGEIKVLSFFESWLRNSFDINEKRLQEVNSVKPFLRVEKMGLEPTTS